MIRCPGFCLEMSSFWGLKNIQGIILNYPKMCWILNISVLRVASDQNPLNVCHFSSPFSPLPPVLFARALQPNQWQLSCSKCIQSIALKRSFNIRIINQIHTLESHDHLVSYNQLWFELNQPCFRADSIISLAHRISNANPGSPHITQRQGSSSPHCLRS